MTETGMRKHFLIKRIANNCTERFSLLVAGGFGQSSVKRYGSPQGADARQVNATDRKFLQSPSKSFIQSVLLSPTFSVSSSLNGRVK